MHTDLTYGEVFTRTDLSADKRRIFSEVLTSNEIKTDPNKIPHDPWIDDVMT